MARTSLLLASVVAVLAASLSSAAAQAPSAPDTRAARNARLGLLTRADREALAPHLEHGPLALVEFNGEAELPAVIFATRVDAPAADVARLLSDPSGYPRFMPALDDVTVRSRTDGMIAYGWTWQTALFTLRGENVMQVHPGPGTRRDRPYRIESTATEGDLGTGRLVFRVYPEGPRRSLLVLSSRIDLRDANYVTRQLENGQRSINRTINISLACVMVLGAKKEAERLAGVPSVVPGELPPLRRPEVDIEALKVLLFRGDLLLLDMEGDRLNQVAVVGRIGRGLPHTRAVMTDPTEFGSALVPGSYARVTGREGDALDFDWGIDMPLVGSSGSMRMHHRGSVVEIEATRGALAGGHWKFETEVYPWGEAAVIGWARFDPRDASFLIRMVVDADPGFGIGITGGSEVMVIRAIRSRAFRVELDAEEVEAARREERERLLAERRARLEATFSVARPAREGDAARAETTETTETTEATEATEPVVETEPVVGEPIVGSEPVVGAETARDGRPRAIRSTSRLMNLRRAVRAVAATARPRAR